VAVDDHALCGRHDDSYSDAGLRPVRGQRDHRARDRRSDWVDLPAVELRLPAGALRSAGSGPEHTPAGGQPLVRVLVPHGRLGATCALPDHDSGALVPVPVVSAAAVGLPGAGWLHAGLGPWEPHSILLDVGGAASRLVGAQPLAGYGPRLAALGMALAAREAGCVAPQPGSTAPGRRSHPHLQREEAAPTGTLLPYGRSGWR
jgi:hypothetical protein